MPRHWPSSPGGASDVAPDIAVPLASIDPIRSGLFDAREEEKGGMDQSQTIVGALVSARNKQLDWQIDDLTPATLASFGMAKLTTAEKAATRYAIEQLSSSASSLEIQAFAESCFGAPRGSLDAKKAAIDDLWREAQNG